MRITTEIENLISKSCANKHTTHKYKTLHIAILKKYYNAADVSIDYHRKRVKMDIVMDDNYYDPQKVNTYIPTLPAFYEPSLKKILCLRLHKRFDNSFLRVSLTAS